MVTIVIVRKVNTIVQKTPEIFLGRISLHIIGDRVLVKPAPSPEKNLYVSNTYTLSMNIRPYTIRIMNSNIVIEVTLPSFVDNGPHSRQPNIAP